MAEEEDKKTEVHKPAEAEEEEGPEKPAHEKREAESPAPPARTPTVEDIEDVLKEAMMEEQSRPKDIAPKKEEVPPAKEVEEAVQPPTPDLPVTEDEPVKKEEMAAKPEETIERGEEPKEMDVPSAPVEDKKEDVPVVEEPKPVESMVEEIHPEPEPQKELPKKKEPRAPEEKPEETKEKRPPEDKKVRDKKPKEIEKKEVSEKEPEPEKPAPRKAKKPPAEDGSMLISPLIFGKFDIREVEVTDPGLRKYINLSPVGIPHTGARHANRWLGKTKINIVERLINNMMRTEHSTGKKSFAYKAVNKAFNIIEKRTNQNPIQVLVDALQNASPKEEITRLRFGGISVPKAVDTSSSRRLDIALRNICKGAVNSSHRSKKHVELCLADEIILASKGEMNSFAISKKEETERIAASAR